MRGLWSRLWRGYLDANRWEEVLIQCRPVGLLGLFLAIVGVEVVLCIPGVGGFEDVASAWVPLAFAFMAVLSDLLAWIDSRSFNGRYAPLFIWMDGFFYGACAMTTAMGVGEPVSYAFLAIYLAIMLYWGSLEALSVLGLVSVTLMPAIIMTIYQPGVLVYSLFGFGVVAYMFVSVNTGRRQREERLRRRSDEAVQIIDEIMDRYHDELSIAHSLFVHDLKNKLGGIRMGLSVLWADHDEGKMSPDMAPFLSDMTDAAEAALKKLQEFLSYHRDLAGRFWLTDIECQAAMDRVVFGAEIPRIEVEGDADRLYLTIRNLVENARTAGAEKVRLKVDPGADAVFLYIVDDGPGLGKDILERLFRPFNTQKEHGSGLGLFLSRRAMRAMNGDLELESTGDDGTTFKITLRRFKPTSHPPAGWIT